MSSQEVYDILESAGADPSVRLAGQEAWERVLQEADNAGSGLSNEINFDYRDLNNAEEFARQVFPFSTWASKAFPMFAARIAENPVIGSSISRYQEDSDNARREQGLSGRFAGSVEGLPEAKDIWSTLTGRELTPYFNPLRSFVPAADAARSASFTGDDDASVYQQLRRVTDLVGFSEHPVLGLIARMSGYAGDAPSQGVPIRQAGPLEALTGIDMAAPGRLVETAARRGMGQPDVADPEIQAALRRVDELAIQQTGQPTTARGTATDPYIRAKVDRSGPIWEQALRETERERNVRSLVGFGSQMLAPSASLSPEEAQISQARAGLVVSAELSREITVASNRAPHVRASDKAIQEISQASANLLGQNRPDLAGQTPPEVQALLDNPTWRNLDRLRDMMVDAQAQTNPLTRGYAGSGSARKQKLQHAVQLYQDAGAVALGSSQFKNLSPEYRNMLLTILDDFDRWPQYVQRSSLAMRPDLRRLIDTVKSERARILRENPDLQSYFDYRSQAGPEANLDAFLKE